MYFCLYFVDRPFHLAHSYVTQIRQPLLFNKERRVGRRSLRSPPRPSSYLLILGHPYQPNCISTMAPLSTLFTSAALLASGASAFTAPSQTTAVRSSTKLYENFGFDFAEDQAENTPQIILGEANYKKWLNSVDPDNMLNRQVSFVFSGCVVEVSVCFMDVERSGLLFRRQIFPHERKE